MPHFRIQPLLFRCFGLPALFVWVCATVLGTLENHTAVCQAADRPNIVWLIVEDMSANYGCYGEKTIQTPNVDALAARGVLFSRAFVTAPICSISRSALITGRYQTSIGAQNHRSNGPQHKIRLPSDVQMVPAIFRNAGYHVNNLTVDAFCRSREDLRSNPKVQVAKTDYNFEWEAAATYDSGHWDLRGSEKPFFVQVQLHGGKFRGQAPLAAWPDRVKKELGSVTDPESVKLPPYLPDDPTIRADWAQYLDTVRYTDFEVGRVLQRLKDSDQLDRTVIFFITDHGISHVRNKQFLYDGGIHIPFIVAGPGIQPNKRNDLVEHIDLSATSMGLAGIPIPSSVMAKNVLASDYQPREAVFAARDRADETVDLIRSVRTARWKYIRNGFPSRPYLQPNQYKDSKAIVQAMRKLYADGKLNNDQSRIMAEARPLEELYDLDSDPYELQNLAEDARHASVLKEMRAKLTQWQLKTGDPAEPESEEVYRAEVITPISGRGKKAVSEEFENNVQTMLRWRTEKPFVPFRN